MSVGVEDRITAALAQAEQELLFAALPLAVRAESGTEMFGFENIVGVGISERLSAGRPTGEPAVAVYVARKAPLRNVDPTAIVPAAYEKVPTDVIESGEFAARTGRGRYRPCVSGVSVGHGDGDTGTVGFSARRGSELTLVSNNHVLARENRARKGDAILQPGPEDGGTPADTIGSLAVWQELDFNGGPNLVDAAAADIGEGNFSRNEVLEFGSFDPAWESSRRTEVVWKFGRTTGLTRGILTDIDATIKMRYPGVGTAILRQQLLVKGLDRQQFSDAGDSGSIVLKDSSRKIVGLLCGGSPRFTLVNRIENVVDSLGVTFP